MLGVLLVDDEPNLRQGIKLMIPWEDLGCEIVGEANDGDEGLNAIMSLRPDIVIADVKMPGKTGIEMIEAAKAMGFKGKALILSGYSDFSYAKTAIALGVENFILKPVDEDELIDAIKTVGEKIRREKDRRFKQEIGREYLNEQLVRGLFAGNGDVVSSVREKYQYPSYCAAIIGCTDTAESSSRYEAVNSFFESFSNADIVTADISGVRAVLFKGWCDEDIKAALDRLYTNGAGKLFICCGKTVRTPGEITDSYRFAESIFRAGFIYRHLGVVYPENPAASAPEPDSGLPGSICAFIEINDKGKMNARIDSFVESMMYVGNTPERAKVSFITLVIDVRSRILRNTADKKPETIITDSFIASLENRETLWDMAMAVKDAFGRLSDECFGKTTKSTMERVVQYIRANYKKELRLEGLAEIFGYNSAYLGKIFHQYTGENFNNFIDEIRISEAKRLLADEEYKVYEVAEMVGYTNINYFHNKFKKNVGVSPLTFKKQHSDNHTDQ